MRHHRNLPTRQSHPQRVRLFAEVLVLVLLAWLSGTAWAGTWTPLTNSPPGAVNVMVLLTDGSVMAQAASGTGWYQLLPDNHGSYLNGTWSALPSMHDTRQYFSLQVLKDGRVFVAGGEVGTGSKTAEVYNPVTNAWTLTPSSGQTFLDSISELLGDGRVMVAPVVPTMGNGTVIYNPATNTWSTGPSAMRSQDEVPWVKLPDGSILCVDGNSQAERYIPALNQWVADTNTPVNLYGDGETGCGHMLANGKAFFRGYTRTALYTPSGTSAPGTWSTGPNVPGGQNCGDSPGAVMTNGNVLFVAGADFLTGPTSFFEYDVTANRINQISGPTGMTSDSAPFSMKMLTLPDGSVLVNAGDALYEYLPGGTPVTTFQPTIANITFNADGSYHLTGTNLNGFTEGAAYGDDFQMVSNYPIVTLSDGAGNVHFARTFNWSSTALQTGTAVQSTDFTLPQDAPNGTYTLTLTASGLSSAPVTFTRHDAGGDAAPTVATPAVATPGSILGTTTDLSVLGADSDGGGEPNLTYTWRAAVKPSGAAAPSLTSNGTNDAKNTTATFHQAGNYTLVVTISDVEGVTASSSVNVVVSQTFSSVAMAPGTANLVAGQQQQITATGLDQFGLPLAAQPTFTWAVASGGGSVTSGGLYSAPQSGTLASVSATTSTLSATATVDVVSAPWYSADVGMPDLTGTGNDDGNGTFTLSSAGNGISGSADQLHYVYQYLCGDGVITARVATQPNEAEWAQAGVMMRATTAAGAAQAMMAITPAHGAEFQFRTATNLSTFNNIASGPAAPCWVRLVRSGSTITAYTSPNGVDWTQQGAANIPMPSSAVLLGLVVGSTNPQTFCTATFDNVSVLAAQNDFLNVVPGGAGTVNVLANDTGPAGTALTVSSFTQGTLGTVVDTGGGVLQYTPLSGTTATSDSFTYTVSDGLDDTATATVVINGLVARYQFDEGSGTTSEDATGNGNTCMLNNTPWTTGIQSTGALTFAGSSRSSAVIPALNLNTNTLTITGWVRRSGSQASFAGLVFCRAGTTACGLHLGTANELRYTWNNASATYNFNSGLTVPNAQWTFVALVVTPTNATLYLQPQGGAMQSAVNSVANTVAAFDGVTTLGQDPGNNSRNYLGALDEVRIYNTPLSMAQIAALAITTPTVVSAAAAAPATVASTNTVLSVLGASAVFPDSALSYTWTTTTQPAGASTPVFSSNGTYAARNTTAFFSQAGGYAFSVKIADGSGSSATSSVAVTVNQTPTYVGVTAGTPVIATNITQQFTATAVDQFGTNFAVQPTFSWTTSGYGSVSSNGLYTAPYASGVASVTASYSGISSANMNVTASTPWLTWVTSTFSADEAQNPTISGPLANPAGDGICNLLKYAFNADPKARTPNLLPVLALDGDNLTFTYPQNDAATDLTYVLEQSQDLTTWTTSTPNTSLLSDDGFTRVIQATLPRGTGTKLMLRLRVVTP